MNPFDNSLIVIDEVHNLTRTLANAKTTNTVKFALYNLILDARGAKLLCCLDPRRLIIRLSLHSW
jgi:hypothetical protein